MENFEEYITKEIVKGVSGKKEELIVEACSRLGIDVNEMFEDDADCPFPKFKVVDTGDTETLYYNNGTSCGVRVITFLYDEPVFSIEGGKVNAVANFKYY